MYVLQCMYYHICIYLYTHMYCAKVWEHVLEEMVRVLACLKDLSANGRAQALLDLHFLQQVVDSKLFSRAATYV